MTQDNSRLFDRRSTVKMLAATTLAAPYVMLSRPALAQSNVLNITTYDRLIPQEFVSSFQRDSGIEVRVRLTDDQGKQYNLLTAEGPSPSTDIVTVTGHRLAQYVNSELLAPVDPKRLRNWGNLISAYREADWLRMKGAVYGVPILAGYEALVLNSKRATDIDSWGAMFDRKYTRLTSYIVGDMISITMLYQGNDGDFVSYAGKPREAQSATNQARDYLIANKHMLRKFYDAGSEVQQMLINEDIYLAQAWSGPAAKLVLDGFPIKLTVPKEGTYGYVFNLNIVKNAPNVDNAYKFLDALMASPEVGAAMTRQSGFVSTFSGVDKALSERERLAGAPPEEHVARIRFFSSENREMKNGFIDRASAEVKAG